MKIIGYMVYELDDYEDCWVQHSVFFDDLERAKRFLYSCRDSFKDKQFKLYAELNY